MNTFMLCELMQVLRYYIVTKQEYLAVRKFRAIKEDTTLEAMIENILFKDMFSLAFTVD